MYFLFIKITESDFHFINDYKITPNDRMSMRFRIELIEGIVEVQEYN